MRNIWIIAKREYDHYFISPIAYVVAFVILLTLGIIFAINLFYYMQNSFGGFSAAPDVSPIFGAFLFLLVLSTPALTMRLIADEARMGTLELLLTAPVRDFELVAGKWLGAMFYVLTLLVVTLIYPIILNQFVSPGIDQRVVMTSYLGVILVAASFLALGTGISAMFTNQIASFFTTLALFVFLWWLVGFPANVITGSGAELFRYLDMQSHYYDTFSRGILELKDILYYLSLIALGLFSGTVAVEMRRWR
ncbi:MAG TPA: ABC transporter permease [Anaerolineales bacterium]|nr:ABC transporter permease [Anaerolineales bacterium]